MIFIRKAVFHKFYSDLINGENITCLVGGINLTRVISNQEDHSVGSHPGIFHIKGVEFHTIEPDQSSLSGYP